MAYNVLKGAIINPTLPSFLVYLNTTVPDVTGDSTNYVIIYDTKQFDQGNNFNLATGTFTAPVTGLYRFETYTRILGGTSISAGGSFYINTTANNFRANPAYATGANGIGASNVVLCNMTAGDTATASIQLTDSGGKVDDIQGVSSGIRTWFSGSLIC